MVQGWCQRPVTKMSYLGTSRVKENKTHSHSYGRKALPSIANSNNKNNHLHSIYYVPWPLNFIYIYNVCVCMYI